MPPLVANSALLQCSFGVAPSAMVVTPEKGTTGSNLPIANIMDFTPMKNVMPFGMCSSPANPMVVAATAAALGVLTPMPCIPAVAAPWAPGSPSAMIKNFPALDANSKCMCNWGGVIQVTMPGQLKALGK
jgi:hypothetical protein